MAAERLEGEFSWYSSIGVKGVKVDFFESDSQERLKLYDCIAEAAARHRLMVNYHGCTKPSGERRRWPYIMTREGVLGAEYYKIDAGPDVCHNCTIPSTRNVVGPMDYTPVTFSKPGAQHHLGAPARFACDV